MSENHRRDPDEQNQQPSGSEPTHGSQHPQDEQHHDRKTSGAGEEDQSDQPRYGVRLTGEEFQRWQQERSAQAGSSDQTSNAQHHAGYTKPRYGTFTPHQPQPEQQDNQQAYGSEYGTPPTESQLPAQQYPFPAGFNQPPTAQQSTQQATMPAPQHVVWSYWMILIAGLLYVLTSIIQALLPNFGLSSQEIAQLDSMMAAMDTTGEMGSFSEMIAGPMGMATRTTMVVIALVTGLLYWLVARGVRRGSNIARIIGCVFAGLSLINLFSLFTVVSVVLGVVAMILTFTPTSQEYFRFKAWEKVQRLQAMQLPPQPPQDH